MRMRKLIKPRVIVGFCVVSAMLGLLPACSTVAPSSLATGAISVVATTVPTTLPPLSYTQTAKTKSPPPIINAVFQSFESGWMLWRDDDRFIYVLFGDGGVESYPEAAFHTSTVAPPTAPPIPSGRTSAAPPFAALWLPNRWGIASKIGWALAPAQPYRAAIIWESNSSGFEIELPDRASVTLIFNVPWRSGGISGGQWSMAGLRPTFGTASFPTPSPTPVPTPKAVNAIYQSFEHGFMLWRADQDCVYAYSETARPGKGIIIPRELDSDYAYCLQAATLPDKALSEPTPAGLQAPVGVLGKVWRYYGEVRSALGYAVAPQQAYVANIPYHDCSNQFACTFFPPLLTLPDGRTLSCGQRAASAGKCGAG
jgi:hypothetical protein